MTKWGWNLSMWRKFPKRALIRALVVIALVWVLGCGALYRIMRQPPALWMQARAGSLRVGDLAPDFSLMRLDKTASVQLSALTAQGHPVVLIFGSYT